MNKTAKKLLIKYKNSIHKTEKYRENLYKASQYKLMWHKFKKHSIAKYSIILLVIFYIVGFFADFIAPYEPNKMNLRMVYKPPSYDHVLGTDRIGRDYFSRIVYGTRVSLGVGLGGIIIATFIGIFLGGISGYIGGITDKILLKVSELIICFPSIVLILMIVTIVGQSLINIIIIFFIHNWKTFIDVHE